MEYVGGPDDGAVRPFPADWRGYPPPSVTMCRLAVDAGDARAAGVVVVAHDTYRRRLSPRDDGPLWQYIHDRTELHHG